MSASSARKLCGWGPPLCSIMVLEVLEVLVLRELFRYGEVPVPSYREVPPLSVLLRTDQDSSHHHRLKGLCLWRHPHLWKKILMLAVPCLMLMKSQAQHQSMRRGAQQNTKAKQTKQRTGRQGMTLMGKVPRLVEMIRAIASLKRGLTLH